ncbi:hypothetical protein AB0N87_29720 [Streptomyces sp. NPDC093228]|uniref:hypothetical protein n=1 Tax=Streptomyces sp. NPDC093228 TaxID=3155070 RepID=UPI0034412EE7
MTDDAGPVFTRRSTVARLALLEAQGDDLSVHEAMTPALQQATAEVGALGGVVHLPCETPDGLYLVASSGLPNKVTDEWAYLAIDRDLVPVRAMHEGVLCWSEDGSPRIENHGAVAVPVPGTERPLGVLTLFLSDDRKPDASGCSFLTAVAGWSGQWLGQRTVDPAPCRGATGREPVAGRAGPADPLEAADATGSRGSAARQTARMAELTTPWPRRSRHGTSSGWSRITCCRPSEPTGSSSRRTRTGACTSSDPSDTPRSSWKIVSKASRPTRTF